MSRKDLAAMNNSSHEFICIIHFIIYVCNFVFVSVYIYLYVEREIVYLYANTILIIFCVRKEYYTGIGQNWNMITDFHFFFHQHVFSSFSNPFRTQI